MREILFFITGKVRGFDGQTVLKVIIELGRTFEIVNQIGEEQAANTAYQSNFEPRPHIRRLYILQSNWKKKLRIGCSIIYGFSLKF